MALVLCLLLMVPEESLIYGVWKMCSYLRRVSSSPSHGFIVDCPPLRGHFDPCGFGNDLLELLLLLLMVKNDNDGGGDNKRQ